MDEHTKPPTLIEMLRERVEATPDEDAFGIRDDDGYRLVSWRSFWEDVERAAIGLRRLGVRPGDRVGILGAPTIEWEIANFGCLLAGGVVVGLDPFAPAERIRDLAFRTEICGVISDRSGSLAEIFEATGGRCRFAVAIGAAAIPASDGVSILGWEDLDGQSEDTGTDLRPPSPSDPATIIFTSGTTGVQKGIPYTHGQVALAVEAIVGAFPEIIPGSRLLCWLPLSNPFQRILDLCAIRRGAISYFVDDPSLLMAAIREVAPDLLIGVPRFYEKLAEGIQGTIGAQLWPARALARFAVRVGATSARARERGSPVAALLWPLASLLDRLVLARIRTVLGGRIRFLVSGSAPLSPALVEFFHGCGLPMYEAYGASENIIPIAINTSVAHRMGSVGRPLVEGSVKIDADGVVHVRGGGVFRGYLGDDGPPEGRSDDGFYRTGDLGFFDDHGFLYLRGREGELIKTSTGRRISLPKVEAARG